MVRRFHIAIGNGHCSRGKLVSIRHNACDRGAFPRTIEMLYHSGQSVGRAPTRPRRAHNKAECAGGSVLS